MSTASAAPRRRARLVPMAMVAALVAAVLPVSAASAAPSSRLCETRNNQSPAKLLECMTVEGVFEHLEAFQAIADANGGVRAEQTPGFDASAHYVLEVLTEAGWDAEVVPFDYEAADAAIEQHTPAAASYETGGFTGTGEGSVTGEVIPIDVNLDGDRSNTSGCEPEDFAAVDLTGADDIVLLQRGTCFFSEKAVNAEAAGAEAVVLFNQGDGPSREGLIAANASGLPDGSPSNLTIPVVGASFADGAALAAGGVTATVSLDFVTLTSSNVIAELPGRVADNVVVVGAHLDSVAAGPGIQDNAAAAATLLELAQIMANNRPHNTIRLAWWGAEEIGLVGSTAWVNDRSAEELDEIALYLNLDIIASPNFIFSVYDAGESSFPATAPVPAGSAAIEDLFERYYTWQGVPYDDAGFSGRSDHQPFVDAGIAAGGVFTGAEAVKTDEQVAIWGGVAGEQFDPCYHRACDTIDNVSTEALAVNADAVAYAVLHFSYSTSEVNGVRGRKMVGRPDLPEPDGSQLTFVGRTDGASPPIG
ncbi:MAG: M28 family peptidase [Actinomycetota bacterium]